MEQTTSRRRIPSPDTERHPTAAGYRTLDGSSAAWRPLRFIQQFGPGRPWNGSHCSTMVPQLLLILLYISTVFRIAESCSSRSTPKPRPTSATMRPNVTFQTYACPEAYAKWYCLNGATCFAVKIRDSILYNCECADGYMGQRCEFKDLDGSYLPSRERVMIERASIAGGVTIAVLLVALISLIFYIHMRRRSRRKYSAYYPEEVTERSRHHLVKHHLTLPVPDLRPQRIEFVHPPGSPLVSTISQSPFCKPQHPQ